MKYDKEWWEQFRRDTVDSILDQTGQKNADYTGGLMEQNPFENFDLSTDFDVDPLVGVCVRMQDKFQRAKAFCKQGNLALNEKGDTVEDIFRDLIGYSLIAIGMLHRDKEVKEIEKKR